MRTLDLLILYRIIKILATPWYKQDAFYFHIIDAHGHVLRHSKDLRTEKEKASFDLLHRFVFNLKRLIEKVPGGKSQLGTYAAALLLLKESEDSTEVDVDTLFEIMNIDEDGEGMAIGAPTNSTGPAIANIDLPLGNVKKKKLKKIQDLP
jgi:hypothetical protein